MKVCELVEKLCECDLNDEVTLWDDCSLETFPVEQVDAKNSRKGQVLLTFNN